MNLSPQAVRLSGCFLAGLLVFAAPLAAQPEEKTVKLPSTALGALKRFEQLVTGAEQAYDRQVADASVGLVRKLKSMRRQIEQSGEAADLASLDLWVRQANLQLAGSQLRQGQVADLLDLLDLQTDVLSGSVQSDGKGLQVAPGRTVLKLPVWGLTAYEVRLQATWSMGSSIRLIAPVGGRSVGVDLIHSLTEQAAPIAGFTLDGEESTRHAISRPSSLTALYKHSFETNVQLFAKEKVRLAVTADRGPYLSWEGDLSRLGLIEEDQQQPGPATAALVLNVLEGGTLMLHGLQVRVVGATQGVLDSAEAAMPARASLQQMAQAFQKMIENAQMARSESIGKAALNCDDLLRSEQMLARRAYGEPTRNDPFAEARRMLEARLSELGVAMPDRRP